ICLHLQLNNLGITCPNCQSYTDNLHDPSYILIRDLSIFGNLVYLKVQPCSQLHSIEFRVYSVWAGKDSLLSLEEGTCTLINWTV
ncbi:transposase family protein, partial [Chamaesiphon sp.]|uniref:transposase family protein n=1 Tax=Chamaesiphon sp. TaxID=2814140 RepID=UPI0035933BFF